MGHTECRQYRFRYCWWKGNTVRIRDDNCRRIYRMFLYPSVKTGHWETEKAGYKNVKHIQSFIFASILIVSYDMSRKTCFDMVPCGNHFLACRKYFCFLGFFWCVICDVIAGIVSCGDFLFENYRSFFIFY